jgi:hypothetical protein
MLVTKTCFRCKETKDLNLFFKHNQTQDGLHSWCKVCCTKGNERSREKLNLTIEGRATVFLRNAAKAAKSRNHPFELVIQDIVDCWEKQQGFCAYSGREMTLVAGHLNTVSIERIDSSVGYTVSNTILICNAINRMKSNFKYNDFYEMCKDVAKFLGDDNLNLNVEAVK